MQPEIASALLEAASLLLVGMVVVFSFLSMLIGAISLIAWVNKLIPDASLDPDESRSKFKTNVLPNNQNVSPKVIAAISAAVRQHRRSH